MDRGLFGTFDYDVWLSRLPEDKSDQHDEEDYIFRGGQWIYVGDC